MRRTCWTRKEGPAEAQAAMAKPTGGRRLQQEGQQPGGALEDSPEGQGGDIPDAALRVGWSEE